MATEYSVLRADIPALGIVNALLAEVAVIDREGTIVLTNEGWSRFANQNAADRRLTSAVGLNYLDVCRSASGDARRSGGGDSPGDVSPAGGLGRRPAGAAARLGDDAARGHGRRLAAGGGLGRGGRRLERHLVHRAAPGRDRNGAMERSSVTSR